MFIIGFAIYKFGTNMSDTRIEAENKKQEEANERAQTQLNYIKKCNTEIRMKCAKLEETIKALEKMVSTKKKH
jgi:hypothetical protein